MGEKGSRRGRAGATRDAGLRRLSKANLPEFTGKDLSEFAESFGRFLRMTSQTHASGQVKCDLLLQRCNTKYLTKRAKQIVTKSATCAEVLLALER